MSDVIAMDKLLELMLINVSTVPFSKPTEALAGIVNVTPEPDDNKIVLP